MEDRKEVVVFVNDAYFLWWPSLFCYQDEDVDDDSDAGRYVDRIHGDAIRCYAGNNYKTEADG